jgi:hypothetical protein
MWSPLRRGNEQLPAALRPALFTTELPAVQHIEAAQRELQRHAEADDQRCWGFFPAMAGHAGIHADLPACRAFAVAMPEICVAGVGYQFNFVRLSLRCQSQQAAYHLDTDAATALTGDPATLGRRRVGRVLLNLSVTAERRLHYLDIDVSAATLTSHGSYVRAASEVGFARYAKCAVVAPRSGRTVHGIVFVANRVLHSGVDGACGHFVAAYGYDFDTRGQQVLPVAAMDHIPERPPMTAEVRSC